MMGAMLPFSMKALGASRMLQDALERQWQERDARPCRKLLMAILEAEIFLNIFSPDVLTIVAV